MTERDFHDLPRPAVGAEYAKALGLMNDGALQEDFTPQRRGVFNSFCPSEDSAACRREREVAEFAGCASPAPRLSL